MVSARERSPSHQALVRAVLTRSAELLDPEDAKDLFANALQAAREFLPLEVCQIAVLRPQDATCDLYGVSLDSGITHRSCPSDVGLVAKALQCTDGLLLHADELARHSRPELDAPFLAPGLRCAVLCALKGFNGSVCGALMCATSAAEGYRPEDLGATRMFALHLGAALELLQARHDLRHWNAIVKSSHAPILGINGQGVITHWNPAAERLFEHTASEAIGRSIALIVPEDRRQELARLLGQIGSGRSVEELETSCITGGGRTVAVVLTMSPIRDSTGEVVGASSIIRDVTSSKQANERFRLAVDSAPNAMILTDESGEILLANAEAERLFGYSRAELTGRSIELLVPHELRALHQSHRKSFADQPQKRAMGVGRDLWALRKDGSQVPVEVGLNPIYGENERTILASIVDISERRKIERERARLLAETQQAVEARNTFLSIASHELKTPLTALQLTVQSLLRASTRQREPMLAGQLMEKLRATNRQVSRLTMLVDQLLDVSRLTARRLKLERARTDLTSVVKDVIDRFAQSAEGSTIHAPDCGPAWGHWDSGRLDQIFTNLVANAVKYGEGAPIEVELADLDGEVVVSVQDRGPGIAPEDQARIFERFERLVSHRHFGGFGLGLWIVRQLVEAHGGRIEVHSQPGQGAQFIVTLPKEVSAT
jgi:PAS domain S-box-containing protein